MSYTAAHWGIYRLDPVDGAAPRLLPWAADPDPSPIGLHMLEAYRNGPRILRPAIRRGWLENGPGPANGTRGRDDFVELEWEHALRLVADEIQRVRRQYGNRAIYAGSYGWSSAGRFHHAQSQLHRFYNAVGGYVESRHSYSFGAAQALLPYLVAPMERLLSDADGWEVLAEHTGLMVCFGGVPRKNAQIDPGGAGRHLARAGLSALLENGARLINISPVRHDLELDDPRLDAQIEWIPIRPNTDTALILALAQGLLENGAHDQAFIARYSVGFERLEGYLLGRDDGVIKNAAWASEITGVPRARIALLIEQLTELRHGPKRILLSAAWALQRAEHGEQPYWALLALATLLGQIGLPGGGFAFGYGPTNSIGYRGRRLRGPTLPQGCNPIDEFIPVARLADMLLTPNQAYPFDGAWRRYPEIHLIHWAGGNPFHHHQDLNRLVEAWQRPDTIIAHEQFWNAHARMADIVLPASSALERDDIGFSSREGHLVAMSKLVDPPGEALDDYRILARLARRLGAEEAFTEGLEPEQWLPRLYQQARSSAREAGVELPDYEQFRGLGVIDFSARPSAGGRLPAEIAQRLPSSLLAKFRADPEAHPLGTASQRIELYCARIAGFAANRLAGHPQWLTPQEWLGARLSQDYPLHLISDQPANKLHSQLDHSSLSQGLRKDGRETLWISPGDAKRRGIDDGAVVKLSNARGSCLACARLDDGLREGVVKLATGAWFDPGPDFSEAHPEGLERHGNPNVLTADRPCSPLTQGCSAQSCLIEVARYDAALPALSCFSLPTGIRQAD